MRGMIFNEIGDIINLCVMTDQYDNVISEYNNIGSSHNTCFRKVKARVVGTSRKFPGFFKFSGYKQINIFCPDVIMTKS